jgi:hypothetical protein
MSFQSMEEGALDKMAAHQGFRHPSNDFENVFHFTREQP